MSKRHLLLLLVGILSCNSEPPAPAPPEKDSALGDEPIPEDFTFQATRPLELDITAQGGGEVETQPDQRLRLEVRSATGGTMYRGSIVAGSRFTFDYPLPPDITELEVVTTDDSGLVTVRKVAIDPDAPGLSLVVGGSP